MPFPLRVLALTLVFCLSLSAQTKKPKPNTEEADAEAAQQRTVAISLVITLADEARSFKDQTRRARVQARAADVLWDTDPDRARELFRRAWEAAEAADVEAARKRADEMKQLENERRPVVIRGGPDLRSEVLRLVAKRDRKLSEEFLKVLDEAAEKERTEAAADQRRNSGTRLGASQRLQLARRLVEDGEVQRAIEFATPATQPTWTRSFFFPHCVKRTRRSQMPLTRACLRERLAIQTPTRIQFPASRHICSRRFYTSRLNRMAAPIKIGNEGRLLRPLSMRPCETTFSKSLFKS